MDRLFAFEKADEKVWFLSLCLYFWPFGRLRLPSVSCWPLVYYLVYSFARHILSFQVKRQCRERYNGQTGIDNKVLPPAHFFKKAGTGAGALGKISEINKCDVYVKTDQKQQRADVGILAPFRAIEQQSSAKFNDRNGWHHYFQDRSGKNLQIHAVPIGFIVYQFIKAGIKPQEYQKAGHGFKCDHPTFFSFGNRFWDETGIFSRQQDCVFHGL